MKSDTFIVGNSVILRPVRESDAENFVRWVNDPEIRKYTLTRTPISEIGEKDWIARTSKINLNPSSLILVIEVKESRKPIGNIELHNINWIDRNATTGSMIGEIDEQGKGYAADAKMHFLKYAFDVLGMHKIISRAIAGNVRSIRYSEQCGYVREAVLHEEVFLDGAWKDIVQLSCFASSWRTHWKSYVQRGFRFLPRA